jgi:hypothetical protein
MQVDWIQLGALTAVAPLGWRMARDMEKRIRDDADKAHEAIGRNIDTLRQEVRQDIRNLRQDVKQLNTRVGRVEGKLGLFEPEEPESG